MAALTGHYRPEHLFVLQQNLELFETCQAQLAACDLAIEAHVHTLVADVATPNAPLPAPRVTRKPRENEPRFEIRTPLHHLTGGVDLTQIDGITPYTALKLISEIGTDMTRWPSAKHFTSWLTLAPKNKISGGRLLSSRTQPSANRAAAIFRMTVMSLGRTNTALGAFYRRLAARIGKPQAITATARKLAILIYRALKGRTHLPRPRRRNVRAPATDASPPRSPSPGRFPRIRTRQPRNRRDSPGQPGLLTAVSSFLGVAEDLLRSEGFTDVQYVMKGGGNPFYKAVASGEGDMLVAFAAALIPRMDLGDPLLFLAGVHLGCLELFASRGIRSITDLKGRTVAVVELGSPQYVLLAPMLAYVGIDPRSDINWVIHPYAEQGRLLAEEKIDAFVAFPPFAQELRAKNIGHVILNTAKDRPWSQYFCCMVVGNREFVQKNPRATKRALRGILKATDICASEPERVARLIMDRAKASDRWAPRPNYDHTLQTIRELPYSKWRQYDPDDTVRFFALRLHEAGMIKSTPQKIIAQATDWRFVNELKKELKG